MYSWAGSLKKRAGGTSHCHGQCHVVLEHGPFRTRMFYRRVGISKLEDVVPGSSWWRTLECVVPDSSVLF